MAILARFDNVMLAHPCPHCGHVLEKKGSWFKVVGRYTCSGCRTQMQMGYKVKIKLFDAAEKPDAARTLA
jgi:transposase-like protein